jgi:glycosyltransferase involved in cell wall biosynthesis
VIFRELPQINNRFLRMFYSMFILPWWVFFLKADIYHFHDPELIPTGLLLKLLWRRVIWDVHEDAPAQIMYKYYLSRGAKRALKIWMTILERLAAWTMDAAVCATPAIAAKLAGIGARTFTVQNFPLMEELLDDQGSAAINRADLAYVGGITPVRGLFEMVRAMECLPASVPCKLFLAGPYGPKGVIEACSAERGWERVEYLGVLGRGEAIALLGKSLAGLVLFHPLPNHFDAQPNKIFEYMSAGLPVIASNFPLWREIVLDNGCGLNVDPLDPQAIAGAISWVLDHPEEARSMGSRGKTLVREKYNWSKEIPNLLNVYRSILPGVE